MYRPKYIADDSSEIQTKYLLNLEEIITQEKIWIKQNLDLLYKTDNVLDIELRHNPYMEIRKYLNSHNKTELIIFLPKYLASQEFQLYFATLTGVDSFIASIYNYDLPIKGSEIINMMQFKTLNDKESFEVKLNTIFRKFLSYQYLIVNK